jgi:aspartate beta-hydroxylase
VALSATDRLPEAQLALSKAVTIAPDMYTALLHLGKVREDLGDSRGALIAYFRAVTRAQLQGQWLEHETIQPWLLDKVLHAMRYVNEGRRALFFALLTPLRERYGSESLKRLERCLSIYLRESSETSPDVRQRARFLYFPDLPTQPFHGAGLFPWIEQLESAYAQIRAEAEVLLDQPSGLVPFLEFGAGDSVDNYLRGTDKPPAWDAHFFYRHGVRHEASHTGSPQTSRVLESLPLVRIREHAPEICFSVLTAGTHILPHHGVTNTRLVVHLPLIVPGDCVLRVGGEEHAWQEGRCVVFDDTFEHEAWNRSQRTRVILLMDAWNPYLSEAERLGVTELVEAIGDFDRH